MSRLGTSLLLAAALGLLGLSPSSARAQGFLVDLYAGVGLPTGALSDLAKPGFSGGLGLGYVFGRAIGVRADFAGEWLKAEDPIAIPTILDFDENLFGRDVRLYHYDAAITLNATNPRSSNWIAVIDIGAGATTINLRGDEQDRPEPTTRFTIPVGIGIGYLVAKQVAVFLRGRWYLMFTDSATFGGSTWSSFPIWGGIGIRAG